MYRHSNHSKIFSSGRIDEKFREIFQRITQTIESETEDYILNVNSTEYVEHLANSNFLDIPIIHYDEVYADSYEDDIPMEYFSNRYDRFAVVTGQKPVEEFIKTGMPDFVVANYTIVMMTAFMEQMNDLNTIMVEHLETYWGDQTSHRFLSALEGDISNEEQMESQGERLIRNELTLSMKGYMIPEFTDNVFGKTAEMGRGYNPKKVSFTEKII